MTSIKINAEFIQDTTKYIAEFKMPSGAPTLEDPLIFKICSNEKKSDGKFDEKEKSELAVVALGKGDRDMWQYHVAIAPPKELMDKALPNSKVGLTLSEGTFQDDKFSTESSLLIPKK
jgi:hypothetical protein